MIDAVTFRHNGSAYLSLHCFVVKLTNFGMISVGEQGLQMPCKLGGFWEYIFLYRVQTGLLESRTGYVGGAWAIAFCSGHEREIVFETWPVCHCVQNLHLYNVNY